MSSHMRTGADITAFLRSHTAWQHSSVGTHYCLAVGNDEGLELDEADKDEELGESNEE